MHICGKQNSIVLPEKVRDYLLSAQHPIGKFKAIFFYGLGYSREEWDVLAKDLEKICHDEEVERIEITKYGKKYIVPGRLIDPSGRSALVVTVWMLKNGEACLRLVTAYPRGE